MAIPEPARQTAIQAVEQYCEDRIPPHVRDEIRLEANIRGNAIDPATATWSLWWADRNDRWLTYPPQKPTGNVELLLAAIDADQSGAFYG